jgi:hypothetical protein
MLVYLAALDTDAKARRAGQNGHRGRFAAPPRVLVTVRPGPVLYVWQDGREVARVPLDMHGTLALAEALLREVRAAQERDRTALQPR